MQIEIKIIYGTSQFDEKQQIRGCADIELFKYTLRNQLYGTENFSESHIVLIFPQEHGNFKMSSE